MAEVYRTLSIDYVGERLTDEQLDALHDAIVDLFAEHELKIDGTSDGPSDNGGPDA